ncbi:MAG TPA: hypothetical protein GXZ30_01650 [Propionibacterium sp.]|jgi:hypothetical protein|nr:hypothetical protein [Propionibacterium sp.]
MTRSLHTVVGLFLALFHSESSAARDERGLSQSTENAVLLAGAVAVAGLVIAAITAFVQSRLPQ